MKKLLLIALFVLCAAGCQHAIPGWGEASLTTIKQVETDARAYFAANPDDPLVIISQAGAMAYSQSENSSLDIDARLKLAAATMETVAKNIFDTKDLAKLARDKITKNITVNDADLYLGMILATFALPDGT